MARRYLVCSPVQGPIHGVTKYPPLCGTGFSSTISNNDTESHRQFITRTSYTLRDLFVLITTNDLNGASGVGSRINGSPGNLSVSIPANTTGAFQDTVNSDSLSSGDLVNTEMVGGGSSSAFGLRTQLISYSLEDTVGDKSIIASTVNLSDSSSGDQFDPGVTRYLPLYGRIRNVFSTEQDVQYRYRHDTVLSNLRVFVNNNGVATTTLRLRVNGANGNQLVSIPTSTTGAFEDSTNTDSISSGDLVNYQLTVGAVDMHNGIFKMTLTQLQTDSSTGRISANAGVVAGVGISVPLEGDSSVNSLVSGVSPIDFGAKNLFFRVTVNTKVEDAEMTFRVNEIASTLAVTVPAGMTGEFEDLDSNVNVIQGDTVDFTGSAPGSGTFSTTLLGLLQTDPIPFEPTPGRAFFFWF